MLESRMAQALQIDPMVFDEAPIDESIGATVAVQPMAVAPVQCFGAGVQPIGLHGFGAQSLRTPTMPAWYLTPVAVIPVAAAAFIIGNVLMMIPWSVF
jgi:hypothetical protein